MNSRFFFPQIWSRRTWLMRNSAVLMASPSAMRQPVPGQHLGIARLDARRQDRLDSRVELLDPRFAEALALHTMDQARSAGAMYADVRLTRTVGHLYRFGGGNAMLNNDVEITGLGVRVLINDAWGFAACPWWTAAAATQVVRDAVAQARSNARDTNSRIDLGPPVIARGLWTTPMEIDPFHVPIEQKLDVLMAWQDIALRHGVQIPDVLHGNLMCKRQERVLATSDGTMVTQRCYSTGGEIDVTLRENPLEGETSLLGLDTAALGWEHFLRAQIPEQLVTARETILATSKFPVRPISVGRYTLVCDGATMAALVDATLGYATQLDRALGYEANAGGTSYLDDPLRMLGNVHVTAPAVTLTANRSALAQLATVRWDEEGIEPQPFTLIDKGVLVDYQTTREQAAWLAPYYQRQGRTPRSNGCAAAEDALVTTVQHPPNFAVAPAPATLSLEDLVADVTTGILITDGGVGQSDAQARNGLLYGTMRQISNGRLGSQLTGGAVFYQTQDLWKRVAALGGANTIQCVNSAGYDSFFQGGHGGSEQDFNSKGEPAQITQHSITAPAAMITDQAINAPTRKI